MDEQAFNIIKGRLRTLWPRVQAIAAQVPPPMVIVDLLAAVRGPTSVKALGLTDEELRLAEENGHYLRNRFTVRKLGHILDIG